MTDSLKKLSLRLKDLREFLNQNQGVRIYRDNFRVRPYGEPSGKGDWLDLGIRKASSPGGIAQGGWKIGPNQIVASVAISRETNSILNDQANREGLVENDAYFQLRTFVLKIIESLEHIAHKDASKDSVREPAEDLAEFMTKARLDSEQAAILLKESITTSFKKKKKRRKLSNDEVIKKRLDEFEKLTKRQREAEKKYEEALIEKNTRLENEKNTLSNLASLGILTVSFGHEIRQQSAQASTNACELEDILNDAKGDIGKFDINDSIIITTEIRESLKYIEKFSKFALHNIKYDKRTRKLVNVPDVFEYVFKMMSDTFKSMHFEPQLHVKDNKELFRVYSYEIDWESIAINLITNSLWAITDIPSNNRKIEVAFSMIDRDMMLLSFSDSGKGLEQGTEESIFIPMQSGKRDLTGNVIGTGMGLSIVKTQIEDHIGGNIKAIANGALGGAEFEFKLPVK